MIIGLVSLGCAKNRVDSELMLGLLRTHGYIATDEPAEAEILIVIPAVLSNRRKPNQLIHC